MKNGGNIKKLLILFIVSAMIIPIFTSTVAAIRVHDTGSEIWIDDDDNGVADRVYSYRDDGTVEYSYLDTNGDGWCDIAAYDRDGDGHVDCVMVDTDHDHFFDEFWWKVDGVWHVRSIYSPSQKMPIMPIMSSSTLTPSSIKDDIKSLLKPSLDIDEESVA